MKMEQIVPKLRYIKLRRRGITQKKEYNIHNTAKVWNQDFPFCSNLVRLRDSRIHKSPSSDFLWVGLILSIFSHASFIIIIYQLCTYLQVAHLVSSSEVWHTKLCMKLLLSHAFHISIPSHPTLFTHPGKTDWVRQAGTGLIAHRPYIGERQNLFGNDCTRHHIKHPHTIFNNHSPVWSLNDCGNCNEPICLRGNWHSSYIWWKPDIL